MKQIQGVCRFQNSALLISSSGAGAFGSAVLRRFLQVDIGEIRTLSRDEKKHDDMRKRYASDKLKLCIGGVRDPASDERDALHGFCLPCGHAQAGPSCEYKTSRSALVSADTVIRNFVVIKDGDPHVG